MTNFGLFQNVEKVIFSRLEIVHTAFSKSGAVLIPYALSWTPVLLIVVSTQEFSKQSFLIRYSCAEMLLDSDFFVQIKCLHPPNIVWDRVVKG